MNSAILVTYDEEDSVREAIALCKAADYQVSYIFREKFLNRSKFGISVGKVEELEKKLAQIKPDVVIYDEILRPSNNYNLASKLKISILDREALILEIFERRATSSESKLQVKLAQLRYEMSRAKEKVRVAKMGEQPGFMGLGVFEVDVYYNDIKKRMNNTKNRLVKAGKHRALHRQSRKRLGFKTISLAGYTSAGKTTLFNYLTGEQLQKSSRLFTTLSTTTRKITIDKESVLISDTVGFISKLPAYMIEAFKSTLEELLYTDVVIVVIDASESLTELKKKFTSCYKTLNEIGVSKSKMIFALNKSEKLDNEQIIQKVSYLKLNESKWIPISATRGKNIHNLKKLIKNVLDSSLVNTEVQNKEISSEVPTIYEN